MLIALALGVAHLPVRAVAQAGVTEIPFRLDYGGRVVIEGQIDGIGRLK